MQNLKRNYTNELMYKADRLTDLMVDGGMEGSGEGIVGKFGIYMYTLLYFKWITKKDLLDSTGNSAQG